MKKNKTVMLLGPPGSGKSTLNNNLREHIKGYKTFAVRSNVTYLKEIKHPLYDEIKEYAEKKVLIPSWGMEKIFKLFLSDVEENDLIILEGFPLNNDQKVICNRLLKEMSREIDLVIYLNADEDILINRIMNRKICKNCELVHKAGVSYDISFTSCPKCNAELVRRDDDHIDYLRWRFSTHRQNIEGILANYRDIPLATIETDCINSTEVFEKVISYLKGD